MCVHACLCGRVCVGLYVCVYVSACLRICVHMCMRVHVVRLLSACGNGSRCCPIIIYKRSRGTVQPHQEPFLSLMASSTRRHPCVTALTCPVDEGSSLASAMTYRTFSIRSSAPSTISPAASRM